MNKVSQEEWQGMPCSVSHPRVFGCITYMHVHEELRGKLDDKSEKCIFTSYSEHSKAYKLYNIFTKNTIINIDTMFKEQDSWNGSVEKIFDAKVPLMEEEDVAENEKHRSQEKTPNIIIPARTPRFSKQHGSLSRSADQDTSNY